jgi:hypothetical protein
MEFSAHARGHIEIEQTLPAKKKKRNWTNTTTHIEILNAYEYFRTFCSNIGKFDANIEVILGYVLTIRVDNLYAK